MIIKKLPSVLDIIILSVIEKNESVYALGLEKAINEYCEKYNESRTFIDNTMYGRRLNKLADKGLLHCVETYDVETRGVPQKRYYLTLNGKDMLDTTKDMINILSKLNI